MKRLLTAILILSVLATYSQSPNAQPIEQTHAGSGWTVLWVIIAIAAGIAAYFLIKKNPRKDAY